MFKKKIITTGNCCTVNRVAIVSVWFFIRYNNLPARLALNEFYDDFSIGVNYRRIGLLLLYSKARLSDSCELLARCLKFDTRKPK